MNNNKTRSFSFYYAFSFFFSLTDVLIFFCNDELVWPIAACNGFTDDDVEASIEATVSMG